MSENLRDINSLTPDEYKQTTKLFIEKNNLEVGVKQAQERLGAIMKELQGIFTKVIEPPTTEKAEEPKDDSKD